MVDQIIRTLSCVGLGMPGFLLALLVLYFAITKLDIEATGLFSTEYISAPWSWARVGDLMNHLWIPAIISAITGVGGLTRIMRGQVLDTLGQPFVEAARPWSEKWHCHLEARCAHRHQSAHRHPRVRSHPR